MLQSDIEGLSAEQIKDQFALPFLPTHVVDVHASGLSARVGIAAPNFGQNGGRMQIQLIDRGGRFVNARPLE
jgi:hypothetical protein